MKETTGQSRSLTSGSFSLVSMFEITAVSYTHLELVIEVVELLKNRIAVNASLGNHVNVEDASASRRALIAKIRTEIHDYPAKPELADVYKRQQRRCACPTTGRPCRR